MALYKYKALDSKKNIIYGLVEAPSEAMAEDTLIEKDLTIISVSEKRKGIDLNMAIARITPKDLVVFSRQFSVLVGASVSIVQALRLLADQNENPRFKAVITDVSEEIDGGARLSDTMAKRPEVFSNFFVNVIRSGEQSGKLDEVLLYLADELEKDYDMMSKIKGAMYYPAFVMTGMGGVGVVMMVYVVPKLTDVMKETGAELPLATRMLIAVSNFLTDYWLLLVIVIIGSAVALKFFSRTAAGKKVLDSLLLSVPIFGSLFKKIYLVRFTRSMQTLLLGGVTLSRSLEITAEVVSNQVYKDLISETKVEVEDGNSMSAVFTQSNVVPNMVSQMLSIGEKTGKLDSILGSISKFYGREIDNIIANLMTLMEPIIMVVMGVAVGIMVAAVIMPMYNMASVS